MTFCFFFFFKQKTAYEMRISDWSSDVCSSDLVIDAQENDRVIIGEGSMTAKLHRDGEAVRMPLAITLAVENCLISRLSIYLDEIGRAACRERVCQYV